MQHIQRIIPTCEISVDGLTSLPHTAEFIFAEAASGASVFLTFTSTGMEGPTCLPSVNGAGFELLVCRGDALYQLG